MVLLAISREFGESLDWLLTRMAFVEPRKRVAKDPTELLITTFLPREGCMPSIGICLNYLSTRERGKLKGGAEILLRISREFAKIQKDALL